MKGQRTEVGNLNSFKQPPINTIKKMFKLSNKKRDI